MQCFSETISKFFYNLSASFQLLFLFLYVSSIVLPNLFHFLGGNLFFRRNQDGYEFAAFSEEEDEEKECFNSDQSMEHDHLVADIVRGGETLLFLPKRSLRDDHIRDGEIAHSHEDSGRDSKENSCSEEEEEEEDESFYSSPVSESIHSDEEAAVDDREEIPRQNADSSYDYKRNDCDSTTHVNMDNGMMTDNFESPQGVCENEISKGKKLQSGLISRDENYLVFAPHKLEGRKFEVRDKDDEEIFGDSCTNGSTSKSSSEWRSSINFRDSGTEDPFSSSSRRSCPKWESYTVFQRYDEEMLFLDRISAQKLHETESLRSIQACPRSISERIVHKIAAKNRKEKSEFRQNPYHELEAAYVAQICLTWEALNWNYKYFQRLRGGRGEGDPGCPAYVAQQFQQFQVLLQRYIENEPYEHGRRPEIYARMRRLAPKLLQVPEYRDSEEEKREELGYGSRISSDSFIGIMEEGIRTFMNFLKQDKESHCQVLAAFFRRNRRSSPDRMLLLLLKKVNNKKKSKLKDLRRSGKCLRKRRLKEEEEMEILMAQIDLKVVSRVLRMTQLNDEQLHWCEDKMSKVRVSDRKLKRDSSPLFFPAH